MLAIDSLAVNPVTFVVGPRGSHCCFEGKRRRPVYLILPVAEMVVETQGVQRLLGPLLDRVLLVHKINEFRIKFIRIILFHLHYILKI